MNAKSIMEEPMQELSTKQSDIKKTNMNSWSRLAWILILIADVGLIAWGAMAAIAPEHLLGPDSAPILNAEYEGFTGKSWSELAGTSPMTTDFMTLVFRMYGIYGVAFSLMAIAITITAFRRGDHWAWWALLVGNTLTFVAAMMYDWTVSAIGPFELTEYLGLGAVYLALAVTVPWIRHVTSETLESITGAGR
jgi:lysylphosphatidylglycerol synthetase-like protein (DUF2156 family)